MSEGAATQDFARLVDGATYRAGQPFGLWQWMREHAPVAWHEPGVFPGFWSVTRFDDVKTVLRDAATFSSSAGILLRPSASGADPGGNRTLALSDAPRHTMLRDAIAGHFTPRYLRTIQPALEASARAVVKRGAAAETIDFVTDIAATIPVEVVCAFLNLAEADRPAIVRWTSDAFCAGTARERSIAHMNILDYFTTLSKDRRAESGNDLVSVLAAAEVDGQPMSIEQVVVNCDNVLVGGTENVRLALASGMLALIEHPGQWALLQARFDEVIDTAIDEILRWASTATHLMRKTTKDIVLAGVPVSAGDLVVCWPPSANRDPRRFRDPDAFDIRRSPNRHLALGAGPHYCIGTVLARMEMRAILRELTEQVAAVECAGAPERLDSIVINGLRRLPLKLVPRQ